MADTRAMQRVKAASVVGSYVVILVLFAHFVTSSPPVWMQLVFAAGGCAAWLPSLMKWLTGEGERRHMTAGEIAVVDAALAASFEIVDEGE